MRGEATALGIAMILAFSGCFQNDDTPDDGLPPDGADEPCIEDPFAAGPAYGTHNHADANQHLASCRMSLLAHVPMTEQEAEFPGAHAVALHDNILAVAVGYGGNSGFGFDLFDVSDPSDPEKIAGLRDSGWRGGDRNLAFSPDGNWLFMANEGDAANASNSAGVRVFGVSDPRSPTVESFYVVAPSGVHTVEAFAIGTTQYVAALNFGVHILQVTTDAAGTARLVPVGRFATATPQQIAAHPEPSQTTIQRDVYGHDTWVTEDPITHQTLLYFAYAYEGVRILDISNPRVPTVIGSWIPEDEDSPHYVHQVKAYVREDGRRIMVVEAETFEDRHIESASPIWILDVTDFGSPELLSTWTNPGGHGSDRLMLSTHFFVLREERVYLSHYHGGVWVLDLSEPENVTVLGYYMPHADTGYMPPEGCCIGWNLDGIPMVFDLAVAEDGTIWAADFATGLYALRFVSTAGT